LSPDHDIIFGHDEGVNDIINLVCYGSHYFKRRILETFYMCIWVSNVSGEFPFSVELEKQCRFIVTGVLSFLMKRSDNIN
jgi:hypothetical protein